MPQTTRIMFFFLYWLCKFFVRTNLIVVVLELSYYVSLITSSKSLTLGSLFLSLLYKGLFALVNQLQTYEKLENNPGFIWFLQLWITFYFPEFIPVSHKSSSSSAQLSLGRAKAYQSMVTSFGRPILSAKDVSYLTSLNIRKINIFTYVTA